MNNSRKPQIDRFIFVGGTLVLLAAVVPIVVAPEWSVKMIDAAFSFLTQQFGIYYIIAACAIFVFLLWVSVSDFGGTVLGRIDGTSDRLCDRVGAVIIRLCNPRVVDCEGDEKTF